MFDPVGHLHGILKLAGRLLRLPCEEKAGAAHELQGTSVDETRGETHVAIKLLELVLHIEPVEEADRRCDRVLRPAPTTLINM